MISPDLARIGVPAEGPTAATLHVDVIADWVCPWSFLGKRRLDEALASVHGPVQVTWHPFQLNPGMPPEGKDFETYLRDKFGDPVKLAPSLRQLTEQGEKEGINFRFDRIARVPNTIDAHRLMHLAEAEGIDTNDLADRLFRAFFEDGKDISNAAVLTTIGVETGLDASDIRATFDNDDTRRIVLAQEAQMRQNGVESLPGFLINKRLFVVGPQPTEAFVSIFDRAMFGEESDLVVSSTIH